MDFVQHSATLEDTQRREEKEQLSVWLLPVRGLRPLVGEGILPQLNPSLFACYCL